MPSYTRRLSTGSRSSFPDSPGDLLLEVRQDIKEMNKAVNILASQNLDSRLNTLES